MKNILKLINESLIQYFRQNNDDEDDNYNYSSNKDIIDGEMIGNITVINGLKLKEPIPVYKNPKSLRGFGSEVRAILTSDLNIYVAKTYAVLHDTLIKFLADKYIVPVDSEFTYYRLYPKEFVAIQRNEHTNSFNQSSSYDDFPDYYLEYFDLANKKFNYGFKFDEYLVESNIKKIIKESFLSYFRGGNDDDYGSSYGQTSKNDKRLSGTLIGYIDTQYGVKLKTPTPVYKNPYDLYGFDSETRGVLTKNLDLYLSRDMGVLHETIINFLASKGIVRSGLEKTYRYKYPDDFMAIQRVSGYDMFTNASSYDNIPDNYKTLLNNASRKFPFEFKADDTFLSENNLLNETYRSEKELQVLSNDIIKKIAEVNVDRIKKYKGEFEFLKGIELNTIDTRSGKYKELLDFIEDMNVYINIEYLTNNIHGSYNTNFNKSKKDFNPYDLRELQIFIDYNDLKKRY
jgi:hypothetical protein